MASSTRKPADRNKRHLKGTTSRQRERLKGALLLLIIPLALLVAALARGVQSHEGEVPDWRPAPAGAEEH